VAPGDDQKLIREFLRDRSVACPLCGYDLRDCPADTCPECGKRLRLSLVATDLSVQAWATLTASISLGAGMGVVFISLLVRFGLGPGAGWSEYLPIAFGIGSIPLALLLLAGRKRFLRLRHRTQRVVSIVGSITWIAGTIWAISALL
jgi:hypothetical protein